MELVQINPVGAQPAQGSLHGADDVPTRPACALVRTVGGTHVHAELGRHDDVLASRSQRPAQEFLTQAGGLAVAVGRVEKSDPGIDSDVDHGPGAGGRLRRRPGAAQVVTA